MLLIFIVPFCPGFNVSCYTTWQIHMITKFWELNNKLRSILNWIYLMWSRFCFLIYGQCKMMTIHVYLTLVSETVNDYLYKIYKKTMWYHVRTPQYFSIVMWHAIRWFTPLRESHHQWLPHDRVSNKVIATTWNDQYGFTLSLLISINGR